MKILVITKISNNLASGISNIVPYHIKYLAKQENVIWYNLNDKYIVDEEMKFLYCSRSEYGLNIKNTLLKNVDIVVFHGVCFFEYGIIAKQLGVKNIPYIIIPHGSLTEYALNIKAWKKKIGIYVFMNKFVRNAKAVHYLSKGEKERSNKLHNKNSIIIGNGIEAKTPKKDNIQTNGIRGIYIGRLMIHNKGIDLLFDACEQMKDTLIENNIKIDIFGPEEKGSEGIILQSIRKKNLGGIITVHDPIFGEAKKEELLKSDFFILTSRSEGQPCSVLEAMSYGIPCLVTEGTNIAEEVTLYNAGWSSKNDIESIKLAFIKLIEEKEHIRKKGINAIKLSKLYEWEFIAKQTIDAYKYYIS